MSTRNGNARQHLSPLTVGGWSARHPWIAIASWLAFVVLALGALSATGSRQLQNGAVGESARADKAFDQHGLGFPSHAYGYLHSVSLQTDRPSFRAAIDATRARLRATLHSPVTVQIAADKHAALVGGTVSGDLSSRALRSALAKATAAHPQVSIVAVDGGSGGGSGLHRAELLSVPVTLLVLLFAFGALVAALVPVLLALTAVAAAFGLLGPISHVFALDSSVKTVVLLIGMAVGVDYALFYVVRAREERRRGLGAEEALARASRTSGHTVLIAGATVAIAVAGQYVIGSTVFDGIASGTITVVACAVAGSVTVLPAVLRLLGPRIGRGRIPFLPHLPDDAAEGRFWPAVIGFVLRRPVVSLVASLAVLLTLAAPALGLHVAKPSSQVLAGGQTDANRIAADFPGTSAPAVLVLTGPGLRSAATVSAVRRLERLAAAHGVAHPPFSLDRSTDGQAAAVALPLNGDGDNSASRRELATLRHQLIPQTLGNLHGVETAVTGATAEDVDFTNQMKHGVPYVIGFVLVLAFLLLLVTFRSLVVPLKAIALNLLSLAASYGVLVLVFQHHWAQGLLGFHSDGTIISWLPLFLFVVLFGLSMDYHVFILSRVREAVDSGMSTDEALHYGIARTAGVVTAAALVMVGVFSLFGTATSLDIKQAGVGLAVAVLLDATVIRGVLLPASMKLLGEWNWYLPNSLERALERRNKPRPEEPIAVLD